MSVWGVQFLDADDNYKDVTFEMIFAYHWPNRYEPIHRNYIRMMIRYERIRRERIGR